MESIKTELQKLAAVRSTTAEQRLKRCMLAPFWNNTPQTGMPEKVRITRHIHLEEENTADCDLLVRAQR